MPTIHCPISISRRDWIAGFLGTCLIPQVSSPALAFDLNEELRKIDEIAEKAKLEKFGRTETAHFFGIGDASSAFRAEALNACEKMASDFLDNLNSRGFKGLTLPKSKMLVVILADSRSFAAFTGEKVDLVIGGHFELDTNRLVMFDYRADQGKVGANAERINSFVLFHETSHLLTFNIGLLNLKGDVPLCVSEGLATYGESWRPRGVGRVGGVNKDRLAGLPGTVKQLRESWIPFAKLILDDELLRAETTQQVAYAQSWIFIHSYLKSTEKLPKLRSYLKTIAGRTNNKYRLEDATTHFGDLAKLDIEMRNYAKRSIGG